MSVQFVVQFSFRGRYCGNREKRAGVSDLFKHAAMPIPDRKTSGKEGIDSIFYSLERANVDGENCKQVS